MRRRLMVLVCAVLGVLSLAVGSQAAVARPSAPRGRVHVVRRVRIVADRSTAVELGWTNPHSSSFAATEIVVVRGGRAATHVGGRGRTVSIPRSRHSATIRHLVPGTRYSFALFASDASHHYAQPADIAAVTAPAAVGHLHTYAVRGGASVHWQNPKASTFDHVVVRYARGYTAPTRSTMGRRVPLTQPKANLAKLVGLTNDTVYSVAVWTVDRHGHRSTVAKRTFTSGALRGPRGVYVGRVVDDKGDPLLNAEVLANSYTGDGSRSDHARTDVDGRFRLRLVPGTWFIDVGGQHVSGGDSDATGYEGSGDAVVVHAGQTIRAGAVALTPGGAITGRVTDSTGHGLGGVEASIAPVQTYVQDDSDSGIFFSVSFGDSGVVHTGSDGRYTIKGVPVSTALRVCMTTDTQPVTGGAAGAGSYADRCLPSAVVLDRGGMKSENDLALDQVAGGAVSGVVSAPSGTGLGGWFLSFESTGDSDLDDFYDTQTQPDGSYLVNGLAPGTYRVCAEDGEQPSSSRTGFIPGCHHGSVTIGAGASVKADIRLATGGAVTGKITGPHGVPLSGVEVEVGSLGQAVTDTAGHYEVKGVPSGEQTACFDTEDAEGRGLPTGALSACFGHRTVFAVRAGAVRNGIDGRLRVAGALSGTVRDSNGAPVPYADVEAEPLNIKGDDDGGLTEADAKGHYVVRGLRTAKYGVCFTEFSDDFSQTTRCRHTAVVVSVGKTTRGVDGVIPTTTSIKVTVHDTAGDPVAGVDAAAVAPCPSRGDCEREPVFSARAAVAVDASSTTGGDGVASLRTLKPGKYAVCLFAYYAATTGATAPFGYADRCSGSTYTVVVRAGRVTSINETLSDGGAVSGTITDGAGHPLADAVVHVTHSAADDYDSDFFFGGPGDPLDGEPAADSLTRPDGSFTIRGVAPGTSTVCVDASGIAGPNAAGYLDQCLGGPAGSDTGGTGVTVTADSDSRGNDLALTPASGISGTITAPKGAGAGGVVVFAGRSEREIAFGEPDQNGDYSVTQLPAGNYSLCVLAYRATSQCYRDVAWKNEDKAPPLAKASLVTTTDGGVTGGIDFVLHK
jgi:protocatechuate 3,4-dioxygenase beta subunit